MAIPLPIPAVKGMTYTFINTYSNTFLTEIWKPYCVMSRKFCNQTITYTARLCASWKSLSDTKLIWSRNVQ